MPERLRALQRYNAPMSPPPPQWLPPAQAQAMGPDRAAAAADTDRAAALALIEAQLPRP